MEIKERLISGFEKYFGSADGTRLFFSPGRVNLIGEHTDYNGGHVFPCALTMGSYALVKKREDKAMHFVSLNFEKAGVTGAFLDELDPAKKYGWAGYLLGVVWAMQKAGYKIDTGFDLAMWGNIPSGAGLSSSASIEVLMGTVIKEMYGADVSMIDIAKFGQKSENEFCGMNCGIMDQFAVAMGKKDNAIFLDTADLSFEYAPVVLKDAKVIITNSHVKHSLVDSAYNDRRRESSEALADLQKELEINGLGDLTEDEFEAHKNLIGNPVCVKRAKHAVYENQRTVKAVAALKNNDIENFGKLMNASHVSLRDDYEVSCPEVDKLVEIEWKIPGVIGARITGGGFGGCTVAIVKNSSIDEFKETVLSEYKKETGIDAEIYEDEIGDGARELK